MASSTDDFLPIVHRYGNGVAEKFIGRYIDAEKPTKVYTPLPAFVVTLFCYNSIPSMCLKSIFVIYETSEHGPRVYKVIFMSIFEVTHVLDLYTLSLSLF